MNKLIAEKILGSRKKLYPATPRAIYKDAEEGGCGVTGFACSIPMPGKHILEPSRRMHNRGNGKGGGIAACGMVGKDLGVSQDILDSHYLMHLALLENKSLKQAEKDYLAPFFEIAQSGKIPCVDDYRDIDGLEVQPPDVWRYFVRAKKDKLDAFIEENKLQDLDPAKAEDEFVWQKTLTLNTSLYDTAGEKNAFIMSVGRNMMILKIVGYAEKVAQYYNLEEVRAHSWIAHQRFPTKGRVWHPGGAHPFMAMDIALVHNGDFANYHSCAEYLKQKNIFPQFHTDTEVSVLMFDLLKRVYGYPLEYVIEALAPTTEMDFDQLPPDKQRLYNLIGSMHIHGSPDGPWFFIIARNDFYNNQFQLIGITDTAMLRPQVFAWHDGEVQVGLICSEKQAIDATLASLAEDDNRICPVADKYWNARGGSSTDGGAFVFTVKDDPEKPGAKHMVCTDKFGNEIKSPKGQKACDMSLEIKTPADSSDFSQNIEKFMDAGDGHGLFSFLKETISKRGFDTLRHCVDTISQKAQTGDITKKAAIDGLTLINDIRFSTGKLKRNSILRIVSQSLEKIFNKVAPIKSNNSSTYTRITNDTWKDLKAPEANQTTLVVDASGFPPEGDKCDARLVVLAYELGWKKFICYGYQGQRFLGCGLGPKTMDVEIDAYGSTGDYLASGIDGMTLRVHGNAQDQLGQILKAGKLVVFGDVGQTFMYGAKGGEVYVMGNAAGRPLINGVGRPKVVINGTALDYLAESFMAGNALKGGGFVILNGLEFDNDGKVTALPTPYPGSNLFSLASGGAIYVRDPEHLLFEEHLNQGVFVDLSPEDWRLILPFLEENERLFDISIKNDLLTVNGERKQPHEVYRKLVSKKSLEQSWK